jgi:hypothetical protein
MAVGGDARRRARSHDDYELNGNGVVVYGDMAAQLGISKAQFKHKVAVLHEIGPTMEPI